MELQPIINKLIAAHRSADADFAAAQKGFKSDTMRSFEFARIIGKLQGEISIAVIDLGFRGRIKLDPACGGELANSPCNTEVQS